MKVIVTVALLLAPLAAAAQPAAGRVHRIGYLATSQMRLPSSVQSIEAFRAGLRDHGHVEGRSYTFELRGAEGHFDRLPALAAELIGLPVDVLVVASNAAARAAKEASRTTPVVFVGLGDPVAGGLVASLARPGGNLTGSTWDAGYEQYAKLLEFVREAAPRVSRVAWFWDLADPASPTPGYLATQAFLEAGARQLGLALHAVTASRPADFPEALAAIDQARAEAVIYCMFLDDTPLLDFLARRRLPSASCWREATVRGALLSYDPDHLDLMRRAAGYVDRILKGTRPADLPVEQPTRFRLAINMKTARALGLTIPPSLLVRADELIN